MSDPSSDRLANRRILIVDDEADIRASIEQALQAEGALTQCCGDGNTAVQICQADPPDLVVLDMMLPKRSGFLVLEKIREQENSPHVIMVTANEGRRHQAYAESLGVDAYLHKPVRLERLITLAQDMLKDVPVQILSEGPSDDVEEEFEEDVAEEVTEEVESSEEE